MNPFGSLKALLFPQAVAVRNADLTQALTNVLEQRAVAGVPKQTAAEEEVAGLMFRCAMMARVKGSSVAVGYFPPDTLAMMFRDLVLNGESVYIRGTGELEWVQNYEYSGGVYVISGKPYRPADIFHARYITDRTTGKGVSALAASSSVGVSAGQLEEVVQNESRAASSYVVPMPADTEAEVDANGDPVESETQQIIRESKGRVALIESAVVSSLGDAPKDDFVQRRIGVDIPERVMASYDNVYEKSLLALGLPPTVLKGDAGSMREGMRMTLYTLIIPYAKIIEHAASRIGLNIELDFTELQASDIVNKAKAYQMLTGGEGDLADDVALDLVGLPTDEEIV